MRPLIEVGWVLDRRLEEPDREAAHRARSRVLRSFADALPELEWRMPATRQELPHASPEEAANLLEAGSLELSSRGWDFAIVVTASDLKGHYVSDAVAIPSRALGVALLSTRRVDPRARDADAPEAERVAAMEARLHAHAAYALGRLGGLRRRSAPTDLLAPPSSAPGASRLEARLDPEQRAALLAELERVADQRVEEEEGAREAGALRFHARAAWRNRREILANVKGNHSWEFPFRMGRLTTAAVSALAILSMTAESWEVAAHLEPRSIVVLVAAAIASTSAYVLQRQRLFSLHRSLRLTEQIVVTRVSVSVFVLLGMVATWALVFVVALCLAALLGSPELVARWSGPASGGSRAAASLGQAAFASGLAILVGALGASFEGQTYVRHVAYVDEEQ